jgi:hypothetical protein
MENKKRNAEHLRNLILLALADNDFCESEMTLIIRIATRLGISCQEFDTLINDPSIKFSVPQSLSQRIEQLNDLVSVMMVDGVMHEKEEKLLKEFIKFYGLTISGTKNFKPYEMEYDLRTLPVFHKFMNTFKLMSAEKISEIHVDEHFNIRLPLYNRVLPLNALAKTLYIFFLKMPEGCAVRELCDHRKLFTDIYKQIPGSHTDFSTRIENLICPLGVSFNQKRSRINSAVKNAIPDNNCSIDKNYIIAKDKERMYVGLQRELVIINPVI